MRKINPRRGSILIFILLSGLALLLFHRAFSIFVFADDFYHFYISQANNLNSFVSFFRPLNNGAFYRPLPTQVFYFTIEKLFQGNLDIARLFVFSVFFSGLVFFYKIISFLFNSKKLALIATLVYLFNFTHIYQLYWLATFQEVAQFTFLLGATHFFLRRRTFLVCLFYLGALFSKEQAILFPIFIIGLVLIKDRNNWRVYLPTIISALFLTLPFILIHKASLSSVQSLPEYRFQLNPRIIANNFIWYSAWAIGFPSFLPDLTPSIFSLPKAEFWTLLKNPVIRNYFISLFGFLGFFIIGTIGILIRDQKTRIKLLIVLVTCALGFLVTVSPTLGVIHKWMVRLTIPSLFFSVALAYIIYAGLKLRTARYLIFAPCIFLYFLTQASGIKIHEDNSTYFFESSITKKAQVIFSLNKKAILDANAVTFVDREKTPTNGWEGSSKLKISLSNDNFGYYFFGKKINAYYGNESPLGFVVFSDQIIP